MSNLHDFQMVYSNFNVSPIKTPYAEPSDALETLKSKVVVIHGSNDVAVPAEQVELVTKLAIAEKWAPPGMLLFYDDGGGSMLLFDHPTVFASIYRKAFEEQVLLKVKTAAHEGVNPSYHKPVGRGIRKHSSGKRGHGRSSYQGQ